MLTGVAGGIGERLRINPVVVRLAFVVLTLGAGAGAFLYLVALLLSGRPDPEARAARPRTGALQAFAVGLVVLGLLLLLRDAGLWLGDGFVWPAALAVLGSAVIWTRGDEGERSRAGRVLGRLPLRIPGTVARRAGGVRLATGALLVLAGAAAFLFQNRRLDLLTNAPLAVAAAVLGLGVILAPWMWRQARQLADERRERIRSEERADMAAHLHDSVLQTLSLMQRTSDPREMSRLARGQERELRTWLYGGTRSTDPSSLSTAIDAAAADVERAHAVKVEVVVVGDRPVDDALQALVHATREAMINAARHSGAREISVYVEVEPGSVGAFVRDEGTGFVRGEIGPDRRGIADSIEGRMARFGGVAVIESAPGRGTEVQLRVPAATTR